jgi:hypothetical protein
MADPEIETGETATLIASDKVVGKAVYSRDIEKLGTITISWSINMTAKWNIRCCRLVACLTRHRHAAGSLTRKAFLSVRDDAFPNIAIIMAGLITAFAGRSAWPDLIVGLAVAAMNAGAAKEVWQAAHLEHSSST